MSLPSPCSWALLNEGRNERLSLQEKRCHSGWHSLSGQLYFQAVDQDSVEGPLGAVEENRKGSFFPSINFRLAHLKNHWGFHSSNKTVSSEQSHIQICLLKKKKKKNQDIPGGPVVKDSPSNPWGVSSIPGW